MMTKKKKKEESVNNDNARNFCIILTFWVLLLSSSFRSRAHYAPLFIMYSLHSTLLPHLCSTLCGYFDVKINCPCKHSILYTLYYVLSYKIQSIFFIFLFSLAEDVKKLFKYLCNYSFTRCCRIVIIRYCM
jgi:hypothetical protein